MQKQRSKVARKRNCPWVPLKRASFLKMSDLAYLKIKYQMKKHFWMK